MRSRKSTKRAKAVLFSVLAFILIFPFALNYLLFSNFDLSRIVKENPFFIAGEETVIAQQKIGESASFHISEPNGVGTSIFSYKYKLSDPPERIKGFSLKTATDGQLEKNILLEVSASGNTYSYAGNDAVSRKDKEILWIINKDGVSEINVSCTFDVYAESTQKNEFFTVTEISANTLRQNSEISKKYFSGALLSLLVVFLIVLLADIVLFTDVDYRLKRIRIPFEKRFLIAAFVMGLLFAVLLPVYQIPDESTHATLIYKELNWNFDVHRDVGDFSDTLRILRNPDQKVNLQTYFDFSSTLPVPQNFSVPSIQIIRHLPQALPLVICTFLHIPSFMAFFLCELSALCFSVLVFYHALKIMPVKKELFAFIILLPVSIQQMGSLSYDATVTPLVFLLIAYIFRLILEKEYVTLKDAGFVLLLVCLIAIIKIPYILAAALWLLIPIKKYRLSFGRFIIDGELIRRRRWLFIILIILAAAAATFLLIRASGGNEYVRVMLAAITDPLGAARIMYKSFSEFLTMYLDQLVSSFGWFDTEVSLIFTILMMTTLILTTLGGELKTHNGGGSVSVVGRIFIFITGLAVCLAVQLSMFTWTLEAFGIENHADLSMNQYQFYFRSLPYIGGGQGRYFLPAVLLLLLPFCSGRLRKAFEKINANFALTAVYAISFVYIIATLYGRYWA